MTRPSISDRDPEYTSHHGRRRAQQADDGIQTLKDKVDTLIVIPNDRLLEVSDEKTSVLDAFKMADEVVMQGVQGVTDLITTPGLVNTDFADVKTVMLDAGSALMGIGKAQGDERAAKAAKSAISSPLLESTIQGARGILLTISGPSNLTLYEVNEAAGIIGTAAHRDANIIFGAVIDDALGDEVRVTVIAAGFEADRRKALEGAGLAARSDADLDELFSSDLGLGDDLGIKVTGGGRSSAPMGGGIDDDVDDIDVPGFLK